MKEFILRGERVILPRGESAAALLISNGVIKSIGDYASTFQTKVETLIDVGRSVLMPGLVDMHVHINEPGRTAWEGFLTATQSAAAGGTTTLVDMPLNSSPVTTTVDHFNQKLEAAKGKLAVDVGYYAGIIPNHSKHLDQLLSQGAMAGKAFLIDSGIDEFPFADRETLREAMHILKRHNKPLLAHAELPAKQHTEPPKPWTKYADYLASRPPEMETTAIDMLIELCEETGCAVHVVHLSAIEPLDMLRDARARGLPITVETSPHYLLLAAEDIPDGRTDFKCAPPIREKANQSVLRQALLSGDIDLVATDHSPCPPDLKNLESGDFATAWGGISSLQYLLPIVWTGLKDLGAVPSHLSRWLSQNPANVLGLHDRGRIEVGRRADFVSWNPDASFEVSATQTHHRHKLTPYDGMTLWGKVQLTMLGGEIIFQDGQILSPNLGKSLMMINR